MKGYVIKTGNGEYFSGFDTESGFGTTKDIENAVIYSAKRYKKQELEEDVPEFENCKVVEITLAEGDLEKTIDNLGEIASGANKAYIETFHREQTYKKALLKRKMKTRTDFKNYYEYLIYKKRWLEEIKQRLLDFNCGFFTIKQIEVEIENCHKQINDQVW